MHKLINIEGIGPIFANRLHDEGLDYQEQFLNICAKPAARKRVAEHTGISQKLILKWTNRADLARINGIGEEYADLLEQCGVDTIPELAHRNPEHLFKKICDVNTECHFVRRLPNLEDIESWIKQAKSLPKIISH